LPSFPPPRDVVGPVLDAIARRKLKPVRVTRIPPPARFPMWTGFAAAASVLLLVGLGTFLHNRRGSGRKEYGTAINASTPPNQASAPDRPADKEVARAPKEKVVPKDDPGASLPPEKDPQGTEFTFPPDDPGEKPGPKKPADRPASDPVLASGAKDLPGHLERVELPLPTLFKLHDLDEAAASGKLRDKLAAPGAYRIELLCKDASKTLGRVQAAFAARKIELVVDPLARNRVRKPLYRNDFAVFAENLTPSEVVRLLARLGVIDRRPPAGKQSAEPRFEGSVVVQPWSSWDRSELASLLKANPSAVAVPPLKRRADVDIHKPLPEETESQILEGKGTPRPTGVENRAIFLSLSGTRSDSTELKRFVATRKPLQPGMIQVFIVLRHIGS
jgi:hypothetical protein